MNPNLKDVSKRIKYIRKKLDMTMEQFGYHLGNSPKSTIATWESGRNIPSQKKLTLIADIGETTIDWIKWGTLEEYITAYLIDKGYELYIKEFPDTSHIIYEDIQESYSKTFSLDKDYELLNLIIKNIFTKYYSKNLSNYLDNIFVTDITPLIKEYADKKHSISTELFFKRASSKIQDSIYKNDCKFGEKEKIIDYSRQILDEMDLAYRDISKYSSIDDFFYQNTKSQFETEKFISDLSKKYNFPYEKNSTTAKFLTNNHDKFKHN